MEELMNKINEIYIKQLKNLDIPHEKFVIFFTGIPGSGKTTLAKKIEEKYSGVRICSDEVRKIVKELTGSVDDKIIYSYLSWFSENCDFKNKFLILDQGIERRYNEVFPIFEKKGYKVFLINLQTSKEVSQIRIIEKLGALDENYVNSIDRWVREYSDFIKKEKYDITIENEDNLDFELLFSKLDKLVK